MRAKLPGIPLLSVRGELVIHEKKLFILSFTARLTFSLFMHLFIYLLIYCPIHIPSHFMFIHSVTYSVFSSFLHSFIHLSVNSHIQLPYQINGLFIMTSINDFQQSYHLLYNDCRCSMTFINPQCNCV